MDDISDFLPLRVVETECKRSGELDKGDESDVMGFDGGGTRTLRYQWDDTVKYILETITRGPGVSQVACGEALADAVSDMRRELSLPECSPRTVRGLSFFFDELLPERESWEFFSRTLPAMAGLALRLPEFLGTKMCQTQRPATGAAAQGSASASGNSRSSSHSLCLRLVLQQQPGMVVIHQELLAALLVCAFLCVFPARGRDKYILPEINFNRLFGYAINGGAYDAKLRCILHYFNRICTNMPDGFVSFERKVLPSEDLDLRNMPPSVSDSSFWSTRKAVLCQFNVSEGGTIEDDGTGCLELDFANAYLGGGVLGAGCVQEEVRFVICPELIAGMLFLSAMAPNEAIEIVGAERFSRYTGYGTGFRFAGDFVDSVARDCFGRKRRMLVAIDALPCPGASQFRQSLLLRDLNKAFCGFLDHASIRGYCTVAGEPPSGGSNSPNLAGNAAQGSSPGKTGKGGEVDRGGGEEQLSRGASRVGSGTGAADVRFRDRRSCEELQNPSDMEIDCADDAEVGGSKNYIESSEFERETTESSHQGSAVGQMTVDGETSGSMSSVKNKRQGPCAPEGEGIRNRKAECEGMKTGNERDEGDGKEEREEGRCGTGSGSGSDGRATEMYSSDRGVAQQISVGIATGNWGCGAFGGDLEVKSMLQWIAASQAGRPFVSYFTYRDQRARRLREVTDWLQREMWTVGELWSMVTSYCGRRLNGEVNIGFFDWLLPMPETDLGPSRLLPLPPPMTAMHPSESKLWPVFRRGV